MSSQCNKALMCAYLRAYEIKSRIHGYSRLTHETVASRVFPTVASPKTRLSHLLSTSKSARPLTGAHVRQILAACRELLLQQFRKVFDAEADAKLAEFEKSVCRQLGIASARATVEHFEPGGIVEAAEAGTLLGIPDRIDRIERVCRFADALQQHQENGLTFLRELPDFISTTSSVEGRLGLLRVAMSTAILHYPGSEHHNEALDLAWRAADRAEITRLIYSPSTEDDIRGKAMAVWRVLHSARFMPTFKSPFNHTQAALNQKRLPANAWKAVSMSVDEALHTALARTKFVDNTLDVMLNVCSTMSMKSRLLVLRGDAASIREADALDVQTQRICEKLPCAYGKLYALVRNIALRKTQPALKYCEEVIDLHEKTNDRPTAAAFAGLHVQLRFDDDKRPPAHDEYVKRIRPHLDSKAFLYRYSHLADFPRLRGMLDRRSAKRSK